MEFDQFEPLYFYVHRPTFPKLGSFRTLSNTRIDFNSNSKEYANIETDNNEKFRPKFARHLQRTLGIAENDFSYDYDTYMTQVTKVGSTELDKVDNEISNNAELLKHVPGPTYPIKNKTGLEILDAEDSFLISITCNPSQMICDKFSKLGARGSVYALLSSTTNEPLLYFANSRNCVARFLSCACTRKLRDALNFFDATALDVAGNPSLYISTAGRSCRRSNELTVSSSSGEFLGSISQIGHQRQRLRLVVKDSRRRKFAMFRRDEMGCWTIKGRKGLGIGLGHITKVNDDEEIHLELSKGHKIEMKGLLMSAVFIIAFNLN